MKIKVATKFDHVAGKETVEKYTVPHKVVRGFLMMFLNKMEYSERKSWLHMWAHKD